ncbi:bifunctional phosphopantothenoylcysteine decarboxylase/phosphopantothenate--cysteine ligase CoaBC [Lactobacillus sp. S2-2]|uniref:bifunctional phosphopantothenoylcysteine decarboxylase/phosphopantothenate--cysteine ligase CoaBC n=1 Tax=Lactobacillus sp. S2-2 TaxID=2692917 RepID=UPI001F025D7B|nr:bifunctional phosphopantothenoylcysteine decarboxylase/phosphopantothenate--cysteine ligase CoaBC [Lactobacillus sp. S2-2]MCF6515101.1 bifunctional phosphopantothenoylcysteine decarboxylase/phosphopantothenate--cysteine ligase CoaBC [Lactobacillus sp. S2-2]
MLKKNIALYVTGGIAAYKSVILLRELIKLNLEVQVVMTSNATKFVTPLTFSTLSKKQVLFDYNLNSAGVDHVELAQWTDLAIIAPATANFIGKMANGIADDFASTSLMAIKNEKKYVFPAMNDEMLNNPVTQRNIQRLKDDNMQIFNSEYGFLAEGYKANGRMMEPQKIINTLFYQNNELSGKKILITAGGTREKIDPVRFIGNNSSGKMGYALADYANEQGADVTLISANSKLEKINGVTTIDVETSDELYNEISNNFANCDVLIMSAAVSDFKPQKYTDQKIKKDKNINSINIELEKTNDILKYFGTHKNNNQIVVGFAAETNDILKNAEKKLKEKNVDMLVLNDVSKKNIGFNSDDNKVTILFKNQDYVETEVMKKTEIAKVILEQLKKIS